MTTIRRHEGWLAAKIGEEVVMMSVDSGAYIGLNAVGARVWDLIETPKPLPQIYADLAEEFEVEDEVCQAEVDQFLTDLEQHGAIMRQA